MTFRKTPGLQQMNLLFNHRAPLHLPAERDRDLTAALADLLLSAAETMCSEPATEIAMEDEDASEVDC